MSTTVAEWIGWIVTYIIDENYGPRHLEAIAHIVGLFNDCKEAEQEIFDFAESLYRRYAE